MTASPWRALANRRMLICVLIGFSSGLPLYLLLNLVPAWLKTEGLSLKAIGAFALIQFPYTWKFVWSPFLDRFALPVLGRRRGWMGATQVLLLGAIAWYGRRVASPLLALERLLERAASTSDRNLHMDPAGSAEVSRVATAFNQLMAKGQQADRHG